MAKIHGRGHTSKLPRNHCYGCGRDNPEGMKLKFAFDRQRSSMVCRFRLGSRYTGPPGHAHGGVIATVLDEAMGKALKIHNVIALTSRMQVEFLKPVPLNKSLVAEGRSLSHRGRKYWNGAEIRDRQGRVLARSRGMFVAIDPLQKFGPDLKRLFRSKGLRLPVAAERDRA